MIRDEGHRVSDRGLNGLELKEAILQEVRGKLDRREEFRLHLSYPKVKWDWQLTVRASPREPGTFNVAVGAQIGAAEDPADQPDHEAASSKQVTPEPGSGQAVEQAVVDLRLTEKILALVERSAEGRIPKRRLQQTLWRFPATAVNTALQTLASRGLLRLEGDLPAFFGPPITGEQRQSAWLSRSRVLLGQREPASPASAHRHPSQHGAAL